MARAGRINLISTTIESTPEFAGVYSAFQKISIGSLIFLILSGVVVSSLYLYLSSRQHTLLAEKDTLSLTISQESVKEGLLLAARQRIGVIDRIAASQKNISALFNGVGTIITTGQLTSLSMDDLGNVLLTVHVQSIDDAVTLVDTLRKQSDANLVSKPQLVQFIISTLGGFDMTLSYVPKL